MSQGTEMRAEVIVSVDPNYLPAEGDLDRDIWIVTSEANLALADLRRRAPGSKSTTVFNDLGSRLENASAMLPTVFEHHPQAAGVTIRGLSAQESKQLIDDLAPEWFGTAFDSDVQFSRGR
ncbi:hypothetical protein ASC97_07580 [Rhizobium sp. Root1203]|nr:hypothetical protein ASC97_07580 [Rhizobium sp. Root1203]